MYVHKYISSDMLYAYVSLASNFPSESPLLLTNLITIPFDSGSSLMWSHSDELEFTERVHILSVKFYNFPLSLFTPLLMFLMFNWNYIYHASFYNKCLVTKMSSSTSPTVSLSMEHLIYLSVHHKQLLT